MTGHELFDRIPCGLLVTDAQDIVIRVNDTFLDWTGYGASDIVGMTFSSLLDAGSQAFYATQYQDELWSHHRVREIVLTLRRADGTEMPILVNARTDAEGPGSPTQVIVAIFDASARQDFELEMLTAKRAAESSESNTRTLQAAAARFLTVHDEEDFATQLAATIREAFHASDVAIATYHDDGRAFHVVHGQRLRDLLDAVRASRTDDRRALDPDQMIIIRDIEEAFSRSEDVGRALRAVRGASCIAVPISDGDTVMGAFVAIFGRPRRFDESTLTLYRALARQSGLAYSRVRLQQRLQFLATRDPLTGVANRFTIDAEVATALEQGFENEAPVSLIFLDLDGFKGVNDRLGHRAGDQVLRVAADRITQAVRDTDVVGRFGGDEFLILCAGTSAVDATHVAERIAAAIRQPIDGLPDGTAVSASFGVATYDPADGVTHTADSLMGLADAAMYASKRAGADRVTGPSD